MVLGWPQPGVVTVVPFKSSFGAGVPAGPPFGGMMRARLPLALRGLVTYWPGVSRKFRCPAHHVWGWRHRKEAGQSVGKKAGHLPKGAGQAHQCRTVNPTPATQAGGAGRRCLLGVTDWLTGQSVLPWGRSRCMPRVVRAGRHGARSAPERQVHWERERDTMGVVEVHAQSGASLLAWCLVSPWELDLERERLAPVGVHAQTSEGLAAWCSVGPVVTVLPLGLQFCLWDFLGAVCLWSGGLAPGEQACPEWFTTGGMALGRIPPSAGPLGA